MGFAFLRKKSVENNMEKKEILSYVGNMQQVAYVRQIEYQEGRASKMKAIEVKNGPLSYTVMADKCLDISELSYRGISINFLSKPGLMGRNHFDTYKQEAQRSIMGGMLFTCGMENICAPCEIDGIEYPMHGRIRTTPTEHLCTDAYWSEEEYVLSVSGEMREAELFGENLVLRRTIKSKFLEKEIWIENEIENQSFREESCMILYHFNVGYPFLTEDCEMFFPTRKVIPRDEISEKNKDTWNRMEIPKAGEEESVFLHDLAMNESGETFVVIYNHKLELGLKLKFQKENLPYFMEWKSIAAGDYVIGLEPANASVYGRVYHEKRKDVPTLAPFEKKRMDFVLQILEGKQQLEEVKEEIQKLL